MRLVGHVLLWTGFLACAFFAMERILDVDVTKFAIATVVLFTGVVLLRLTSRGESAESEKVQARLRTLDESLVTLSSRLEQLRSGRSEVDVFDVHRRIDDELAAPLAEFANNRESMIPVYGMTQYAEVMTRFAKGERLINRAWSASADGYVDEVWQCLDDASAQLDEAQVQLRASSD